MLVRRRRDSRWLLLPSFGCFLLLPFISPSEKNVFCSWSGFSKPLRLLLSLPSPPSRNAGDYGSSLSWGVKGLRGACRWQANGLGWVVSMKVSHNLILKWKPWVKLLSLFHQAHQGLPFPLWKLYFTPCFSNPSVASINDPVEVCGAPGAFYKRGWGFSFWSACLALLDSWKNTQTSISFHLSWSVLLVTIRIIVFCFFFQGIILIKAFLSGLCLTCGWEWESVSFHGLLWC